jgi:hypothetical protein
MDNHGRHGPTRNRSQERRRTTPIGVLVARSTNRRDFEPKTDGAGFFRESPCFPWLRNSSIRNGSPTTNNTNLTNGRGQFSFRLSCVSWFNPRPTVLLGRSSRWSDRKRQTAKSQPDAHSHRIRQYTPRFCCQCKSTGSLFPFQLDYAANMGCEGESLQQLRVATGTTTVSAGWGAPLEYLECAPDGCQSRPDEVQASLRYAELVSIVPERIRQRLGGARFL